MRHALHLVKITRTHVHEPRNQVVYTCKLDLQYKENVVYPSRLASDTGYLRVCPGPRVISGIYVSTHWITVRLRIQDVLRGLWCWLWCYHSGKVGQIIIR
jgi:hypothetical protein